MRAPVFPRVVIICQSFENCSEHALNGLGKISTRSSSSQRFDSVKWIRFWSRWSLPVCCNQFLSAVMWSLRFPYFWSCVCHYMRFTTLRTRPVNIDRKQCSSMPDLLSHFTSLDADSQAVFLFRRPTRLKEGSILQYVCRRVYIFKWKAQN